MRVLASESEDMFDEYLERVDDTPAEPSNVVEALISHGWEESECDSGVEARILNTAKDYDQQVAGALAFLRGRSTAPENMSVQNNRERTGDCNRIAMFQIDGSTVRFFEKRRAAAGYGYACVTFWDNHLGQTTR